MLRSDGRRFRRGEKSGKNWEEIVILTIIINKATSLFSSKVLVENE